MTIGKSSKKNKAPQSPPFLDRADGFYTRLDEGEAEPGKDTGTRVKGAAPWHAVAAWSSGSPPTGSGSAGEEEPGVFDFEQGTTEDDGATLLERKPSRMSRRWSRRSSKRVQAVHPSPGTEMQSTGAEGKAAAPVSQDVEEKRLAGVEPGTRAPESLLVHFSIKEEADDQVLISERKERQREVDEKRSEGETEEKMSGENMKVIKRSTLRNYRKVLDRAVRRGWETFVANLYSVTLTPISSSSSSPAESTMNKKVALAEYR